MTRIKVRSGEWYLDDEDRLMLASEAGIDYD